MKGTTDPISANATGKTLPGSLFDQYKLHFIKRFAPKTLAYGNPGLSNSNELRVQGVYNIYKSQLDTKLILFYIKKLYETRKRLFLLDNQLLFYTNGFFVYNISNTRGLPSAQLTGTSTALSTLCSRNISFRVNTAAKLTP